jgi:hypothetical protein
MKEEPEPIDDDLVDPDIAATIIIGDPYKKRRHWSDKPTAAERRGAPQIIPPAMWDRIAQVVGPCGRKNRKPRGQQRSPGLEPTVGLLFGCGDYILAPVECRRAPPRQTAISIRSPETVSAPTGSFGPPAICSPPFHQR